MKISSLELSKGLLVSCAIAGLTAAACGGEEPSSSDGFTFTPMGTGDATVGTGAGPGGDDDGDSTAGSTGGSDSATMGDGDTTAGDTGGPPPDGEHALGTILLGESHAVDAPAAALAILSATFVPDAAVAPPAACGMDVGGCQVSPPAPACVPLCTVGETCVYNDACVAECQAPCDAVCAADEVCYFPIPGTSACRKVETFDAGRLDIFGTISPITLYPPYTLPAGTDGPLAMPDKELTVMATGSSDAGFAPFEAKVTTTDAVFSTLDQILPTEAFGVGDLMIGWVPGAADLTISLVVTGTLGNTGTVTCEADDTTGSFAVPRAAIDAAIDAAVTGDTANTIAVSIQRVHTETTTGLETQGTLLEQMVQPEGWIDFSYVSVETGTLTNL